MWRSLVALLWLALLAVGGAEAQKTCRKDVACGNTCIAADNVCRIGAVTAPKDTINRIYFHTEQEAQRRAIAGRRHAGAEGRGVEPAAAHCAARFLVAALIAHSMARRDKPNDLDPARGLLTGVLLGVVLWALLIATCVALKKG